MKDNTKKIFFSIVVFVCGVLVYAMFHPATYTGDVLKFFILYALLVAFLTIFNNNKIARFFLKALWLPGVFIIAFYPFMFAILSVILSYSIVYLVSVFFFEILTVQLFHYRFTRAVNIFFEITITSIAVAYYYDKLVSLWYFLFFKRNEKQHKQLSFKIMNQSRAKFSIYFLYFVALLVLHASRLNGTAVIKSNELEASILESFGTFMAFERVIANWNLFKEEKSQQ